MSQSFDLVCDETRKLIWIGQGPLPPNTEMTVLYSGEPRTMEALRRFLNEHRGKALRFIGQLDLEPDEAALLEYERYR